MTLPRRARLFLAVVVVAAGGLQAYWLWAWREPRPTAADLGAITMLTALAVLAQNFPLPAGPRRKVDVAVAVYLAEMLLYGAPSGMALVGLAHLVGQATLARRRDGKTGARRGTARSVLFNTAQMMLAVGVSGAAYYAWVPRAIPAPLNRIDDLWAIASAGAALYLTNSWAVALMIGLQRGKNPLVVWSTGRGADLLQYGAVFALGLSMALLAMHQPWALLLMVVPAAIVHVSLRQMLRLLAREQAARADADRALQSREEFISVAAHELKSPLAGLLGYTHLLLRGTVDGCEPEPEELKDTLNVIGHQARKLERLVGLLLDSKRIEMGKLTLDRSPTDLTKIVSDVVASAQAGVRDQLFVVRMPSQVVATVDGLRLEQVLANLVDNAMKYSPDDEPVELEMAWMAKPADAVTTGARDAAWVRIAVEDHGAGIPPEHRDHVFDRFFQAHGNGHLAGLGLGLYISRWIVEAHGGRIGVESPSDGGTRFVIELPASAEDELEVAGDVGGLSAVSRRARHGMGYHLDPVGSGG